MMDASSRKDVRRAEKVARQADRTRIEVLTSITSTTQGRQWLWELLESTHIFGTVFNSDPLVMSFLEGERTIGLRLLDDIMQNCPDQYITMSRESNARRTAAQQPRSPDTDGGDQGPEPDDYGRAEGRAEE